MRPLLMIEGVKNLHDARYCAAVGIAMASFDLRAASADRLAPAFVGEVVEWLSGLEVVGVFGNEDAETVAASASAARLTWVMFPRDYPMDEAAKIPLPKIFDFSGAVIDAHAAAQMNSIAYAIPDALFLISGDKDLALIATFAANSSLLQKTIARCDRAEAIFALSRHRDLPFLGFSLGRFAMDQEGQLDYDACDAFTASYYDPTTA